MKTLFLLLITSSVVVQAQENLKVSIAQMAIDSSMHPAFTVDIPQTESKKAIKIWGDQLVPKNIFSTFKKIPKMEKEDKDKWYISGVVVDEICPDTLTVYTRINSYKDGISFATLFQSEKGFIGGDDSEIELNQRVENYVRKNAVEIYKQAVQDELDGLKKELKKMENDYSGYGKDNKKLDRKARESQSNVDVLRAGSGISISEEGLKEIKKEEKDQRKYEKKKDKNTNKQEKLEKEIKKMEDEIKAVQEKLKNIK